jgi:hypothetical protein
MPQKGLGQSLARRCWMPLTTRSLVWSHREQGATGPEAVFSYAVPAEKSHYLVEYCCVYGKDRKKLVHFKEFSAYQGQIAVDPSNGTILRLVLRVDPKPTDPFVKADIVVEYGPVKIGGKTYICPVRSVALSLGLPFRTTEPDDKRLLQTRLNVSVGGSTRLTNVILCF